MSALWLEIIIILFTIGLGIFMKKKGHKHVLRKLALLFVGVLLFELMSEPMWLNVGFSSWAYLFRDITWVITLGWVSIFMSSMLIVDYFFGKMPEKKKFWLYLIVIEIITLPLEILILMLGYRSYASVLTDTMTGKLIFFTTVPVEAIFAIPLFAALILTFYKYFNMMIDSKKN